MKSTIRKIQNNRETLDLKEFMLLDGKKQSEKIEEILKLMYEDTLEVSEKHVEKVLDICFEPKDKEIYLPYSLQVSKKDNELIFEFKEQKNFWLLLFLIFGFLLGILAATYIGINILRSSQFNIDINDDGIPELNLDLDDDNVCDVNCDTTGNKKPNTNIDYANSRKPVFNVIKDGKELFNKTNQDLDGDGVCDLNCDDDNDGDCDRNCIEVGVITNGGSLVSGNNTMELNTASLIVIFERESAITSNNLYPDDQPGDVNKTIPEIVFSVENYSDQVLTYKIEWLIAENTFTSNNMWYKIEGSNGGYSHDWQTLPKQDSLIKDNITIQPGAKHVYTVSLTLHGINDIQNYDQGKRISARVKVESMY